MNYRHAFHAGNFADVLKHLVFAWCLNSLTRKDKPFCVIDTHAGVGRYDLTGDEATRSPEWKQGVARVLAADPPDDVVAVLAPYLNVVRALNPDGGLAHYPGSPELAVRLTRAQDGLRFCERHPDDAGRLQARYDGDARVRIEERDGYQALKSYLPPPQRRGIVMIDPSFEHVDEMYFLAQAAKDGLDRWESGTFVFWRPLKDLWAAERFDVALAEWLLGERGFAPEKILRADAWVREIDGEGPLAGAGVLVVNPPYQLDEALLVALPWLCETLAQGPGAGWRLDGALGDDSLTVDEF